MAITVERGVYSAALGLLGAGIVILFPNNAWVGDVLILSAIVLLSWGVRLRGQKWWQIVLLRRLPPQLYVSVTPSLTEGWKSKSFSSTWDPEDLRLSFRGDGPYSGWPPGPTKENSIAIEIYNAGPGDVRHVVIRWSLPGVNMNKVVQECGLFADIELSLEGNVLRLVKPDRATTIPLLSDVTSLPVPLIRDDQKVRFEAPEAFTTAYVLCCLAAAKARSDNAPMTEAVATGDLGTHMKWMDSQSGLAQEVDIELQYVSERGRRTQRYSLQGWMRAGGPPISTKPKEDGSYSITPGGYGATVENVVALPSKP